MNKQYIAHNDEGRILSTGTCDEPEYDQHAGENESVIEGTADLGRR
jgi:hypothetical protein